MTPAAFVARVQYERLVADPETELEALCAALGEDYDPAMAAPERLAPVVVPARDWHQGTRVSPTTARVGRWRGELEPWEAALCETVLAGRMERFGYELTARDGHRSSMSCASPTCTRRDTIFRRLQVVKDRWDQRFEPNPVAALLTSGQRARTGL